MIYLKNCLFLPSLAPLNLAKYIYIKQPKKLFPSSKSFFHKSNLKKFSCMFVIVKYDLKSTEVKVC